MTLTRKTIWIAVLTVLGSLISTEAGYSGAWTQARGHFYYKLSAIRFKASTQYLLDGERIPLANNGEVTDLSVYSYLEYGLRDALTLVLAAPLKKTTFDCAIAGCNKSSTGVGDVSFGLRYRLSNTVWVVSLQTDLKVATAYETNEDVLDSAPPLGDGQTDFDVHVLVGRSILNYRGYINVDVGYRARAKAPVDEIPFALEAGFNLTKDYVLSALLHGVRGISDDSGQQNFQIINGKVRNFVGTGALEDFTRAQLQLTYRIASRVDLSFSFDRVLSGRNTSRASTAGVGVAFHN